MAHDLILIPTYNEIENVEAIAAAVFRAAPEVHILFLDDNSPDGTGALLDRMVADDARVHVLHRARKEGLGRAYLAGFAWMLARDYRKAVTMDADLSHEPEALPQLLQQADAHDLVVGSRYLHGIRIMNWPLSRLLLSKCASYYARALTGLPFTDPTGGYNCFRREVLEALDLRQIRSVGYSFLIEMKHATWMAGFKSTEVPIVFTERRSGRSKMSTAIMRESMAIVWRLVIRQGFRRRPRTGPHPRSVAAV